jgi:hypothetical protein
MWQILFDCLIRSHRESQFSARFCGAKEFNF